MTTPLHELVEVACIDAYGFFERFLRDELVLVPTDVRAIPGPQAVTVRVERPRVRLELHAEVVGASAAPRGWLLRFDRTDLERSAQLLGLGAPGAAPRGQKLVPRATPRRQVQGAVWLREPAHDQPLRLQNLGLGGMCFETLTALPLARTVDADLDIEGETRRIHIAGVVAWIGGTPERLLVGVRFDVPGPGTRARLSAVLARHGRDATGR